MRRSSNVSGIVAVILCIGFSSASGGVSFTFDGTIGAYTLPREVGGYIDGNSSPYNQYIWTETTKDQYGYNKNTYKYKHPFTVKTRPNAGVNFGMRITFPSRVGLFFEGCRTSSILDEAISRNEPVTLPGDASAMIPHDYRVRTVVSNDYLYTKSFQFGLGLSYSIPLRNNVRLVVAGSYGRAYYSQYFHIETKSVTMRYFQNDGHLVYTDNNNQGSFDVFGIRYGANCLKPAVTAEWDFKPPLSVRIGLAYPVSRIEKGVYFTETNPYDGYSHTFYPSKRFWAGNVVLNAGVTLKVGKGGSR